MKGDGLIKGDKPIFPCFELDSIDSNQVRLTYWFSNKNNYSRSYEKKNGYWVAYYSAAADTLDLVVYSYIGKDKIISLQYQNDSSKDKLKIVTTYKDSIEKIYLVNNLKIKPSADIDFDKKIFDDQLQGKGINEYHVKDGHLQLIRTVITKSPENSVRDTSYHQIGNHSIFWWSAFGK
jgi:hypothetical protein